MKTIEKIRPNTDILIRGAKHVTTRFPACLAKVLRVGETFDIQMADRKGPMKGRVTKLEKVPHGINVTMVLSKKAKRRLR